MKALILTPYHEGSFAGCSFLDRADLVLCADTAYREAEALGLVPDAVIGDFDHAQATEGVCKNVLRVPCEKDDTDTMLCIKYAIEAGARELVIAGGIGGRLDHTIANLQSLGYAEARGVRAILTDGRNEARVISGRLRLPRKDGFYLSVFAFGGPCRGVSESGVRYPLRDAELSVDFPLGVSNEITDDYAEIEVREGRLLVVLSGKETAASIP